MLINVFLVAELRAFRGAAVARLNYIRPDWRMALSDDGIDVETSAEESAETVRREVNYAVYREKIYQETLPLRQALVEAVMRP